MHVLRRVTVSSICLAAALTLGISGIVRAAEPNMRIGTNLRAISWGGGAVRSGSSWIPSFLDELAEAYSCVRFMEWQRINETDAVTWAQRDEADGITYLLMAELCNRVGTDGWWCVPTKGDDSFIRGLATLLRDNLNDTLTAYIEIGNELWNTANPFINNVNYAAGRADALGICPPEVAASNWTYKAAYFQMYRLCQAIDIFTEIYGAGMRQRVQFVAGSFVNNPTLTSMLCRALRDTIVNPSQHLIDAFAIAPYFGNSASGADLTLAMTLASSVNVPPHLSNMTRYYNDYYPTNARLIAYEGGAHYTSNASAFASNSQAYDVYMALLDRVAPYLDLFCHYTHTSTWTSSTAWGAKSYTGQPLNEAHKYRALLDWQTAHPYAKVSVAPPPHQSHQPTARQVRLAGGQEQQRFDILGRVTRTLRVPCVVASVSAVPDRGGAACTLVPVFPAE